MVGAGIEREQLLDGRDEIVGDGAADAAIGQLDDILRRAIGDGAALQDLAGDGWRSGGSAR